MRRTLFGFLTILLAVGPAAAAGAPVIDGVISPGEWDTFYLDTIKTDWPFGGGGFQTAVDVYLVHDDEFWYLALAAWPDMPGWATACTQASELTLELYACGDPNAPPEDVVCFDSYPWCTLPPPAPPRPAVPETALRITMIPPPESGQPDGSFLYYNTGPCPGFSAPEPLAPPIEWGYFGLTNGGCDEGLEKYHFRLEMKIPRARLLNAESLMIGGFFWAGERTFVGLDPLTGAWYDCACNEGAPLVIPIDVDIKPGNTKNCINLDSNGLIKVAILTTDDYDPLQNEGLGVYCQSVEFLGVTADRCRVGDVNSDGRDDLLALYRGRHILRDGEIDCEASTTMITGITSNGGAFAGEDNICYLGKTCE